MWCPSCATLLLRLNKLLCALGAASQARGVPRAGTHGPLFLCHASHPPYTRLWSWSGCGSANGATDDGRASSTLAGETDALSRSVQRGCAELSEACEAVGLWAELRSLSLLRWYRRDA
jgi:hypothetical protein